MKIAYISSTSSGMFSQSIYFDLMQEFVTQGHDVYCVYAEEKRNGKGTRVFQKENINYLGVKTGNLTKNPNLITKGIATIAIDGQFTAAIKRYFGSEKFDLILFSTPPITFVKTLKYFKSNNVPIYLMLKDIFPQNAIDLGMFKENGLLHKYFLKKEKKVYDLSDYIGVMSPANKSFLLNSYPYLEDKVSVLPNSIKVVNDNSPLQTRIELGLPENDVLFLYGGNIGRPQSPEFIIECIDQMETIEGAQFIICGWGAETGKIVNHIEKNDIKRTQYLGTKDVNTFNQITKACDVGLIFLDYRFKIPNFPQRLLGYLNASLPVICATDRSTDLGKIAQNNNFGFFVPSNSSHEWVTRVKQLTDNQLLRKKMGARSYVFLQENYDIKIAYNIIINQIKENHYV